MREEMYEAVNPLDDFLGALYLLCAGWNDRTDRWLDLHGPQPYIEYGIYTGGYTKDERSGGHYFKVTPRVVEELRGERLLDGGKPHWGFTDTKELRVIDGAHGRLQKEYKARLAEALRAFRKSRFRKKGKLASKTCSVWKKEGDSREGQFVFVLERDRDERFAVFKDGHVEKLPKNISEYVKLCPLVFSCV